MPDTNITFTRVEPGWWRASTGETIVRRPFTGWQDDPTFPWVVFDAGKPATFRNRGPAFATLAEAKARVRSRHAATWSFGGGDGIVALMRTTCGAVTANHQTPAGTPPAAGPATGAAVAPAGDPLTGGGADVVVVPDEIRERIAALENDRADASEAEDRGEPVDIVEEVAGLLPDQP